MRQLTVRFHVHAMLCASNQNPCLHWGQAVYYGIEFLFNVSLWVLIKKYSLISF